MKRIPFMLAVAALALTGCSNAPIAGTMDTLFPSRPTRKPATDPRDIIDRERDPLPPPDFRSRDRDDPLPPPRIIGGLQSQQRTEPEPPARGDPFRPRRDDSAESLPPPLPAPGFLDPIAPGRN